jgi:hypothetical protein
MANFQLSTTIFFDKHEYCAIFCTARPPQCLSAQSPSEREL